MPPPNAEQKKKDLADFARTMVDEARADKEAAELSARAKARRTEIKIRNLNKDLDEVADQFNALRKSSYPKPVVHPCCARPGKGKDDFVRVIIPDVHAAVMDRAAVDACLQEVKRLDPDEVVIMGDLLECGGFLAGHQSLGYVSQTKVTYQQDVTAAIWFLDELAKAAPRARVHYLEGNHEDRVERWVVDQTMRHERESEFLRKLVAPEFLLGLAERGIAYYRRGERYHGLEEPGMIRLGKILFVHELSGAKNAAANSLATVAANVNFAHTHREDTASLVMTGVGLVKAWNAGCLCRTQPLWRHSNPTNWSHGFGIEFVAKSGEFLHVNVPIWKGKSLMGSFLGSLK